MIGVWLLLGGEGEVGTPSWSMGRKNGGASGESLACTYVSSESARAGAPLWVGKSKEAEGGKGGKGWWHDWLAQESCDMTNDDTV